MGGDLTQGTVKGDEIACPFHDWRWGGDGKCKEIPYAKRIPLRARTRTLTCDGGTSSSSSGTTSRATHRPTTEIPPPDLPGVLRRVDRLDVGDARHPRSHCREIIDNVVDMAHFFYIHFAFPKLQERLRGPPGVAVHGVQGAPGQGGGYGDADLFLKSEATYFGPAYMINWLDVDYKGFETEVILINCHYPTRHDSFTLQYGMTVKKTEGMDDEDNDKIAGKYSKLFGEGFLQDVEIWKNKCPSRTRCCARRTARSTSCAAGTSSSTSTSPTSPPEMTQRFEFEVDTTKANEYWQKEVAENLRQRSEDETTRRTDGLLRTDQRRDARGPAALPGGPPGRGRLPDCLATVEVQEEQRAPHQHPVERRGGLRLRGVRAGRRAEGDEVAASCPRLQASIEAAVRDGRRRRSAPKTATER